MISIIKSTLKIILRNKVFWFFLIIAPFVSTLILNNKQSYSAFYDKDRREIVELGDNSMLFYMEGLVGFEPTIRELQSHALPLGYRPNCFVPIILYHYTLIVK